MQMKIFWLKMVLKCIPFITFIFDVSIISSINIDYIFQHLPYAESKYKDMCDIKRQIINNCMSQKLIIVVNRQALHNNQATQ